MAESRSRLENSKPERKTLPVTDDEPEHADAPKCSTRWTAEDQRKSKSTRLTKDSIAAAAAPEKPTIVSRGRQDSDIGSEGRPE